MKTCLLFAVVTFAGALSCAASQSVLLNIVFNEVLTDATGSGDNNVDTDCDGVPEARDEFVEIYNINSEEVDVSGLQFWDPFELNYFTIPDGTVLGGYGFLVVVSDTEGGTLPPVAAGSYAFSTGGVAAFFNSGENLILYDPSTDQYIQAIYNNDVVEIPETQYEGFSSTATRLGDVFYFGQDIDGVSLARETDGGETAVVHNTIGDGGVLASPGTSNTGVGLVCQGAESAMPSPAPVAEPTASPTQAPTAAPTASPTEEPCPCRKRFRVLCRVLKFGLCFPW